MSEPLPSLMKKSVTYVQWVCHFD